MTDSGKLNAFSSPSAICGGQACGNSCCSKSALIFKAAVVMALGTSVIAALLSVLCWTGQVQ